MKFLDEAKIFLASGHGGGGSVSFRREKFIEYGGPDGGAGGKGGDVIIVAANNLNTLIDFRYAQHFKAKSGTPGMGRNRTGAGGADVIVTVPVGTQILSEDKQTILADFTRDGQKIRFLQGGRGGLGNASFKSSVNQAPRFAQEGEPGEEIWVWLRLKLIADAGLVGLPNAGKSTFLSVVSRAKPKIADYPFTTLHPQLGVVQYKDNPFVIADIPGLIAGASEGHGLGDRFLGHVERCAVLLHLIDASAENFIENYSTIRHELESYGAGLATRPELIILTKNDTVSEEEITEKISALREHCGEKPYSISSATGNGIESVLAAAWQEIQQNRTKTAEAKIED